MSQESDGDRTETEDSSPAGTGSTEKSPKEHRLEVTTWREVREQLIKGFFLLSGGAAIIVLLGIFVLLIWQALPAFWELGLTHFFLDDTWNPTSMSEKQYGLWAMIVSTLMVTLGAMVISVPLGIGCAAYLSEVAHPMVREFLKPAVEILASLPSVVIGFLGITVVGPFLADLFQIPNGLIVLNGSILLGFMALPTIVSISEDAMNAVPGRYKEASFSLGASRWQTTWRVVIPSSLSGIIAAVMLGMGRAVGETMAVLMVMGNATDMPEGYLDSGRTLTATIAMEMGEVAVGSNHYHALFMVALVLFLMTFVINLIADMALYRNG